MRGSRIHALVLYAQYSTTLSYYDDWKDAFISASAFNVDALNICDHSSIGILSKKIHDYEFIIILHSAIGDTMDFILPYTKILQSRRCRLLSFVANEVNLPFPSSMKSKIDFLNEIGADFIGTQLPLNAGRWLFEDCHTAKVVALPHALNPKAFEPTVHQSKRKIDIGVRSHKYLPYLGDNERNDLLDFFAKGKFSPSLRVDINLKDRFNRADWAAFLNSCKATLANEAGSYYLERDDKTVNAIANFIKEHHQQYRPDLKVVDESGLLFRLRNLAPRPLREWYKTKFGYANESELPHFLRNEIQDKFFQNYPRPKLYTKAISSRHFDAIGTKTLQIMFPGKFNGILQADVHYLSLEKDFSNINDILKKFKDLEFRIDMVDRAYEHVLTHHTYGHRIAKVIEIITGGDATEAGEITHANKSIR